MTKTERLGLPHEQWGGRKRRSAADLGIDKLLSIDYTRITKRPLGIVDLDANDCFDRIVRPVGVISMVSLGLHHKLATCFLNCLNSATHNQIIKGHISSRTYPKHPDKAQGVGKGVTGAGTSWITTGNLVTKEYNHQAAPPTLTCPQKQLVLTKISTAFIDDRTLYTTANSGEQVKRQIEDNVIKIQNSLALTGVAINIAKSSWTIIADTEERLDTIEVPRLAHELTQSSPKKNFGKPQMH